MRGLLYLIGVATVVLVPAWAAVAADAVVTGVRTGIHPDKTRLVVDLDRSVQYNIFTLSDPYRVVIDLPDLDWQVPSTVGNRTAGLITRLRFGLFRPGNSRVVLDLKRPVRVKWATILPPRQGHRYRFVIDLVETDRASFLAALAPPKPVTTPTAGALLRPKPRAGDKKVVVIDAGHGGVDPGTTGASGGYEKAVTLTYAKALAKVLRKRYRVVLTRDRDIFLPLQERVQIARDADADLFMSLHADAIADPRFSGGAVYTLSETASDAEAAALAAKENKSDVIAGIDLSVQDQEVASILIDLAQRETKNFSSRFAGVLVSTMRSQGVRVRRKPHRFAGFRVLKAPDVPSVLVELGYLSNPREEARLKSARGRTEIVNAISDAVDAYFRNLAK